MGNGAFFFLFGTKKPIAIEAPPPPAPKKDIERRPIVTKAGELLSSLEGKERINYALSHVPPGTGFRWNKVLLAINRTIEPTEDMPDPLRVDLTEDEMKTALSKLYDDTTSGYSEGIGYMRNLMPQLFDKHSVERGRRVSQRERNLKGLNDECYSYGEIDYETFATIFSKISIAYGVYPNGQFFDLGCGVGTLVYTAALMGTFNKSVGVDNLESLVERGTKRIRRWDKFKEKLPRKQRDTFIDFIQDDITEATFWSDATFIFLHWTAFNIEQRESISNIMNLCKEGTIVVSVTHLVQNSAFMVLKEDKCEASWGTVNYYVQEKLTLAKKSL